MLKRGHATLKSLLAVIGLLSVIVLSNAQAGTQGGVVVKGQAVPTTSSTGTSATGTTGGTTGATAGDGSGLLLATDTFLVKMEERLHAPSQFISGGVLQPAISDRHVVRLKILCPYSTQTTYDATGYWVDTTAITCIDVPAGTEVGSVTSTLPSLTVSTAPGEPCAQIAGTNSNWYCYIQHGTSGAMTTGQIKYYAFFNGHGDHFNTNTNTWDNSRSNPLNGWYSSTLTLDKIELTSVSLDSRTVFGQSNIDGELPGDPNADARNNNFANWIYRGGHFVGNLPYGTANDQSGKARTQLQLVNPNDATNYLAGCVSAFASGTRASFSPGTIGLFRPAANDGQLGQGLLATWSSRWTLNPGGTQSGAGDFVNAPYYTYTPNTNNSSASLSQADDQFNYINWQIPYASVIWQTQYGGDGNNTHTNMWQYFGLCQTDETATAWQYFGSTWIEQVTGQVYPLSDSRIRIWKVH